MTARRRKRYEGSPADKRADARNAAKAGVSLKAWERSKGDKTEDAKGQKALDAKRKRRKKRA